ncbi:uncharacterized protein STEHIDRAFT_153156 [Stereum hirsutum FP-91666 SS1]|uniref:uncharacterized protein n=1 Tax=Stereum hirsutum (strain FP-91666) TaxID=721885 RepID=UPI000440BE71|nr:uncharacterized protein STEHIDRAFT_153156 [Stereum hirsutum FP-91666 SS1]EIM91520.1 hypothetical protein STEHIDRAFT_153156 [Stereum hirsutum FP-91666 SS1]
MSTRLWKDEDDKKALAHWAAPDSAVPSSIPVYLCITRNTDMGILHWVIAWEAFPANTLISPTTDAIGWKILEVRNPHEGNDKEFALRFSFRRKGSATVSKWDRVNLGHLDGETREALPLLGQAWIDRDMKIGGNCVTCVREMIQSMTRVSDEHQQHGKSAFPATVIEILEEEKRKDCEADPKFEEIHMIATTGHSRLG